MHKKLKPLLQRVILTFIFCFTLFGLLYTTIPIAVRTEIKIDSMTKWSSKTIPKIIEEDSILEIISPNDIPVQMDVVDFYEQKNQNLELTESFIAKPLLRDIQHPPRGALIEKVLHTIIAGSPHDVIEIAGDDDFATQASMEGWSGTGEPESPYIIQNYEIDSGDTGKDCIYIRNTRVHFVIQYCTFIGGEYAGHRFVQSGVQFYNVSNGVIADVTAYDHGECGIYLRNSSSNTISSATVTGNWEGGIRLDSGSYNNIISDCSCSGNDRAGVVLRDETVRNNTITGNELTNNPASGVALSYCEAGENIISFNTITYNEYNGVSLFKSHNNTVINNTCNLNNDCGIYVGHYEYGAGSESNLIANNTCNDNIHYGILLGKSHLNTLETNECKNNEYPIYIDESNNNTIEGNVCETSDYGIFASQSDYNILKFNIFADTSWGMFLEGSNFNVIGNHTIDSIDCGVCLSSSNLNTITNLNANGLDFGIYLDGASNNTIESNVLTENNEYGIGIDANSDFNIIENNYCAFNQYGIYMEYAEYNSIIDCICVNSTLDGISTKYCYNSHISGNTLSNNSGYGLDETGSDYMIITNNMIEHNSHGFRCGGDGDYLYIAYNEFKDVNTGIVFYSDLSTITDNIFHDCLYSIRLFYAWNNRISNHTLVGDIATILLEGESRLNRITDNLCKNSTYGIQITGTSYQNMIANNTCIGNVIGIYVENAPNNDIEQNNCSENEIGIYLHHDEYNTVNKNDCSSNIQGIVMNGSISCTITENICEQNSGDAFSAGLVLDAVNTSVISLNIITTNNDGIVLIDSNSTSILNNTVSMNTNFGISLNDMSYNNNIHWNIFNLNDNDDIDDGIGNYFDYNYWSSYTGVDANADGFGDTPYEIPGEAENEDPHPLVFKPIVPIWNPIPTGQTIECGEHFNYDLDVDSISPIRWWINDIANFAIDENGVITDTRVLKYGEFLVEVRAYNLYNASCSAILTFFVNDTIAPIITSPGDFEHRMSEPDYIYWTVSDLNPGSCIVYKSGWRDTWLSWTEETEELQYNMGYIEVGWEINFTLVATDAAGNNATDTVIVTVIEEATSTTTTTGTTTVTGFDFGDATTLTLIVGSIGVVLIVAIIIWKRKKP